MHDTISRSHLRSRDTVERLFRGVFFFFANLLKLTKGEGGKRKEYFDGREMWTVELKGFEGNP